MPAPILVQAPASGVVFTPGTPVYYAWAQGNVNNQATTEANAKTRIRTAGTASRLWAYVSANSLNVSMTILLRNNGANGNQSISVGAGATGAFEDAVNSDALAAADQVNWSYTSSAGTGTAHVSTLSNLFLASSNSSLRCGGVRNSGRTFSAASTNNYISLGGGLNTGQAEAIQQAQVQAGSIKNLFLYVTVNGRSTTSTFTARVNGAGTALTASISAAATGEFEDTSNTVTINANDLVCTELATGTGTGNLTVTQALLDYVTTNNSMTFAATEGPGALGTNLTRYFAASGNLTSTVTEANISGRCGMAGDYSKLSAYISANTLTSTSTVTFRKNSATNLTNTVSIGSGATGRFDDTTHTDTLVDGDTWSHALVTGASGTSITLDNIEIYFTPYQPWDDWGTFGTFGI